MFYLLRLRLANSCAVPSIECKLGKFTNSGIQKNKAKLTTFASEMENTYEF